MKRLRVTFTVVDDKDPRNYNLRYARMYTLDGLRPEAGQFLEKDLERDVRRFWESAVLMGVLEK